MRSTQPTIVEFDMKRLADALRRAEESLPEDDYAMLKAVVESYGYIADLVGNKNTTIHRLRKLLFGAKTEKTAAVLGKQAASQVPALPTAGAPPDSSAEMNAATAVQPFGSR